MVVSTWVPRYINGTSTAIAIVDRGITLKSENVDLSRSRSIVGDVYDDGVQLAAECCGEIALQLAAFPREIRLKYVVFCGIL
jgi:hypothetical protein